MKRIKVVMHLTPLHKLVIQFIEQTNLPIFLTGKAGTGKTTFLHYVKSNTTKSYAVVAPTAVAAINAGGVTIHSFFQVPFGPLVPSSGEESFAYFTGKSISQEKTKLIKCLELLIIDEISMVRADLLDYIDSVLRYIKGTARPFGGVQLLMIGDLYQLPPVSQTDWPILGKYYRTSFFFSSQIFKKQQIITFELTEIFRQKDSEFIEILNAIRSGHIERGLLEKLNTRAVKSEPHEQGDGYVTLTTHNALVKTTNDSRLAQLAGIPHVFKAAITGDFPKDAYPAEESLLLKIGAQVMFVKNDSSGKRQYYNGRTARISSIEGEEIKVIFLDDQSEFKVNQEIWQNVKYSVSEAESKVKESNSGTFTQYPLRLAWAITIHKSQALTFDKVIVDVNAAFAAGQAYVALSRCRDMEGLILKQPLRAENVTTDPEIVEFMERVTLPDLAFLDTHASDLDRQLIEDLFDFTSVHSAWNFIKPILSEDRFKDPTLIEKSHKINMLLTHKIKQIGDQFKKQELALVQRHKPFWELQAFTSRLSKASAYFVPTLGSLNQEIVELHARINTAELPEEYYSALNQLISQLKIKITGFTVLPEAGSSFRLSEAMTNEALSYWPLQHNWIPPQPKKTTVIHNPALYEELITWREAFSQQRQQPDYTILSEKVLREVSAKMPRSLNQLSAIKNFGEIKAKDFGEEILEIILRHGGEKQLF